MGWGYDSYYPPYVSVAERRAKAEKEVAKRQKQGQKISPVKIEGTKITTSFWGNSWCKNLESYSDYSNRLPRGRSYVRNGSVVDLQIEKGQITALVSGSELYKIKITISELVKNSWTAIKGECAGQIGSLVELLQGKLSKQVMEIVTRRDSGLFPKPREIKMHCSCPDSAGMCKHLAAVLYGIGARLDTQPELLFILRHVDHLELIEDAGKTDLAGKPVASGKKTIATADLSDMFGIEMAGSDNPTTPVATTLKSSRTKRSASSKSGTSKTISNITAKSNATAISPPANGKPEAAKPATQAPRRKTQTNLKSETPVQVASPAASKPAAKNRATSKAPKVEAKSKPGKTSTTKSRPSVKSLARSKAEPVGD